MKIRQKLHHLRSEFFFAKSEILLEKGMLAGLVMPFDDDFYEQMSHTFTSAGIPVSMEIKYLLPLIGPGKCFERSLYMFLCFDDALLVRGDQIALALKFGRDVAGHGWIERGDFAYDPTLLMKFDKSLYYEIFGVKKVERYTAAEYCQDPQNKKFYDEIKNTTLVDYQPTGRKRLDLLCTIPVVKGIADNANNPALQKELAAYLTSIDYNEEQDYDLLIEKMDMLPKITTKNDLTIDI